MSEISPDGVLAVHPHAEDQLTLAFSSGQIGQFALEQLIGDNASNIHVAGRSAAGQLGMDVVQTAGAMVDDGRLHVPIVIEPHTEIARTMVTDLGELRAETTEGQALKWQGNDIQFGRLVNYDKLKKLEKDEIERAIANRLIAFGASEDEEPAYEVNDDGSISLPLSLLEFVFNEEMLRQPEQRFNALHHGRAGLIPHMDTVSRRPDEVLPGFSVGGAVFSPGSYYVKIRECLDEKGQVRQLPSASLFDGNRLMGINSRHDPYSRNRQVEIVNQGRSQTYEGTWVTVDVLQSTEIGEALHPVVDWRSMTLSERSKLHRDGVSPLDVIKASDPISREFLLEAVGKPDTAALVISSHGISRVPSGLTSGFTAQNIREAARSFGRYRDIPDDLEQLTPFVEALKPAADRSRLVVADELELRHIPNLVKSGDVRALLMRRYLGGGSRGVAMAKEDHSALVDLVRQGVSVAWENEGDLREMHRSGLWLTPEGMERIEGLDLVIAMYGSHLAEVSDELEPSVDTFFQGLTGLVDAENVGITHGNMAGVMAMADWLARQRGIMSLGVGLDLSAVGQAEVNLQADGFLILDGSERLYRQEKLDKFNTISIFNVGGFGTLEELFITICSQKLNSRLPTPNILIAPDNLYANAKTLVNDIAERNLGQPWVSRTIELVGTYDEALSIIEGFWKDPKAYWRQAGISPAEIGIAYKKHLETVEQMGMQLAANLQKAAGTYEG